MRSAFARVVSLVSIVLTAACAGTAPRRSADDARSLGFLDAGAHVTVSPIDGVHLDEAGHAVLGLVVAEEVAQLVG